MKKTARTFTPESLKKVTSLIAARIDEIETDPEKTPRVKVAAGNIKIGAIPAFNLPPVVTCTNCASCSRQCYAVKDYRGPRVKSVSTSHCRNLAALMTDPVQAFSDLDAWLTKHRPEFFRIHSSGDFHIVTDGDPLAYARMWYDLAVSHPETRFLAFTKDYAAARAVPFDTLDNFSLVLSEWCDDLAAPDDLKKRYRTSRAVKTLDDIRPGEIVCPGHCEDCGMCWNLKKLNVNVAFEIH